MLGHSLGESYPSAEMQSEYSGPWTAGIFFASPPQQLTIPHLTLTLTVIDVENGTGKPSSNQGKDCVSLHAIEKGMNLYLFLQI